MQTRYILLISAIISVIFSWAASVIPIWILNQWEVSALYPTLIVPATYTFSIWSLIYLSWIVLWILAAVNKIDISRENTLLLAWAQVLSSFWLIPSQYLWTGTSLIVILGVLYLLLILFFESRKESIFFKSVAELFLWWIVVASLANLHLVLVSYDIYFLPVELTFFSILWGLILNIYFIKKHHSYVPAWVFLWALIWIILWQDNSIVQITSWVSILAIAVIWAQDYIVSRKLQK